MSAWDPYVDTLKSYGNVQLGGIYGHDGSTWAASPQLKITAAEISKALTGNNADFAGTGIYLGGEKYIFLRKEETSFGFMVQIRKGNTGASIGKSKTCAVIGIYGENDQAGGCSDSVHKLADYLFTQGI